VQTPAEPDLTPPKPQREDSAEVELDEDGPPGPLPSVEEQPAKPLESKPAPLPAQEPPPEPEPAPAPVPSPRPPEADGDAPAPKVARPELEPPQNPLRSGLENRLRR